MEFWEVRCDAVSEHEAVVTSIVGFADRRVDAHLGGDAADDELMDVAASQDSVEVGSVKRTFAWLVHDGFANCGPQLVDNVVAVFAVHENAAHRTGIADAGREPAARLLCRRQVCEVGPMTLARVDDENAGFSRGVQHARRRRHRLTQERDVVAQCLAESTRIDEIALHVDDDKADVFRLEHELIRLCSYRRHDFLLSS